MVFDSFWVFVGIVVFWLGGRGFACRGSLFVFILVFVFLGELGWGVRSFSKVRVVFRVSFYF